MFGEKSDMNDANLPMIVLQKLVPQVWVAEKNVLWASICAVPHQVTPVHWKELTSDASPRVSL